MFICKICDEEYDENMRYSRDSRYCKKCGEERTQYLSYRRDTLASLRSMPLEAKIIQTKFLINQTFIPETYRAIQSNKFYKTIPFR